MGCAQDKDEFVPSAITIESPERAARRDPVRQRPVSEGRAHSESSASSYVVPQQTVRNSLPDSLLSFPASSQPRVNIIPPSLLSFSESSQPDLTFGMGSSADDFLGGSLVNAAGRSISIAPVQASSVLRNRSESQAAMRGEFFRCEICSEVMRLEQAIDHMDGVHGNSNVNANPSPEYCEGHFGVFCTLNVQNWLPDMSNDPGAMRVGCAMHNNACDVSRRVSQALSMGSSNSTQPLRAWTCCHQQQLNAKYCVLDIQEQVEARSIIETFNRPLIGTEPRNTNRKNMEGLRATNIRDYRALVKDVGLADSLKQAYDSWWEKHLGAVPYKPYVAPDGCEPAFIEGPFSARRSDFESDVLSYAAKKFPSAYSIKFVELMRPDITIYCWQFCKATFSSGTDYSLLCKVNNNWRIFPEAWNILRNLVKTPEHSPENSPRARCDSVSSNGSFDSMGGIYESPGQKFRNSFGVSTLKAPRPTMERCMSNGSLVSLESAGDEDNI